MLPSTTAETALKKYCDNMKYSIRKALITDASNIQLLVNSFAANGFMLTLSRNDVYERIMEFAVCESASAELLGVCSLHPTWSDIAEIRSLAVLERYQGLKIGSTLVFHQLEQARALGFMRVFTLTYKTQFFSSLGFTVTDKDKLPKKMWTDCLKCIKYPNCDETAMIIEL
jgi:amino-acid N-acetyltransferase